MEKTLKDSAWAHRTKPGTAATTQNLQRNNSVPDLPRLNHLITRLRWKSDILVLARKTALNHDYNAIPNGYNTTASSTAGPIASAQFDLDFLEWYTLLERVLVLQLAFVGVSVPVRGMLPPEPVSDSQDGGKKPTAIYATKSLNALPAASGSAATFSREMGTTGTTKTGHRFHANLLDALARVSCPLRDALGTGRVYELLQQAKAWRMRGKNVDCLSAGGQSDDAELRKREKESEVRRVEELQLDEMVATIVAGVDGARAIVEQRLDGSGKMEGVIIGSLWDNVSWNDGLGMGISEGLVKCDDEEV